MPAEPDADVRSEAIERDLARFGLDDPRDAWLDRLREVDGAEAPALGTIGAYELIEEVSRGGQGIVFRARVEGRAGDVALKRLIGGRFATLDQRRRFERELVAAARLDHPGIIAVFGIEQAEGQPVLAMEWVDGTPINAWAEPARRAGDVSRLLRAFTAVCDAVQHAHQRGVIHRDLKPSNILVDARDRPHVLDFGLAKLVSEPGDVSGTLTGSGQFLGTPDYAAPEQVLRPHDLDDLRTDVHALGSLLYEMLTGGLPYAEPGQPPHQTLHALETSDPVRPSRRAPALDRELEAIIMKAIARDPEHRYPSVDALRRDVERAVAGLPVEARGDHSLYVAGRFIRRHRGPVAFASLALLVLVGSSVAMAVLYARSERDASHAQRAQAFLERTLAPTEAQVRGGELTVGNLLASAADRIDAELSDVPEAEAGVRLTLARAGAALFRWPEVELHAGRAVDLYRGLGPREEARLADALAMLGSARAFAGDPRSVELQREALEIRRRLYGERDARVAAAHASYAYALWSGLRSMERADEADEHYRRAETIYAALADPPRSGWARDAYSHAAFLHRQGRVEEAERAYRHAIARYEQQDERLDLFELRCREAYGRLLLETGRAAEARSQLETVLAIRPVDLVDPSFASVLRMLGRLEAEDGAPDRAAVLLRRALAMWVSVEAVARQDRGMADLARAIARADDLAPLVDPAWRALAADRVPSPGPDILRAFAELAVAQRRAGAAEHAAALLHALLTRARRDAMVPLPLLLPLRLERAGALLSLGRTDEAVLELDRVDEELAAIRRLAPPARPPDADLAPLLAERDALHERVRRIRFTPAPQMPPTPRG